MTVEEYKAFCLKHLNTHAWQKEDPELASMYRENYLSGGWSEEEITTIVTLHMLNEYTVDHADEELMLTVWHRLPVRKELRNEVIRKCEIEGLLQGWESLDEEDLSEDLRQVHKENLTRGREDAMAASLGVFPGMPEYDAWMRRAGLSSEDTDT